MRSCRVLRKNTVVLVILEITRKGRNGELLRLTRYNRNSYERNAILKRTAYCERFYYSHYESFLFTTHLLCWKDKFNSDYVKKNNKIPRSENISRSPLPELRVIKWIFSSEPLYRYISFILQILRFRSCNNSFTRKTMEIEQRMVKLVTQW